MHHYYVKKGCIKKLRRELGLSTSQLAHKLGVSQSTALRLEQAEERGAITLLSLERAARALGARLDYRFISERRVSQGRKREPAGLARLPRYSARKKSINDRLLEHEARRNHYLSPEDRVRQACELSDLGMKIKLCSSKP